jgi:DNA polymerase-3 subunit epsilon
MVANALPINEHGELFTILMFADAIITFNSEFDMRMLGQSCAAVEMDTKSVCSNWHCAMRNYAAFRGVLRRGGGYRWWSLTDACHQMGIPVNDAHSALGDALMTLELLKAMAGLREGV